MRNTGIQSCSQTYNITESKFFRVIKTQLLDKQSESEVAQSCPTLCHPMDSSLPGSAVHGIFQARILDWVAISFSRESLQPRNRTHLSHVSCIGRRFFTTSTTSEALKLMGSHFPGGSDGKESAYNTQGPGLGRFPG